MEAQISRNSMLPRLAIDDGTLEGMKWLAVILMTIDHMGKHLFNDTVAWMFYVGRLTMPLFGFVLAFNLARHDAFAQGVHGRVIKRLAIYGTLATVPFIALGGLGFGWWPLNIMAMLLLSTAIIYFLDKPNGPQIGIAVLLFIFGSCFVEFWHPAVGMVVAAWYYCKRPGWLSLTCWATFVALLWLINRNAWAMASFAIILAAPFVHLRMPRMRAFFYAYYPLHLAALWAVVHL